MKSLMWFRNDLRIDDNPALKNACIESDEVHAIYIFSSKQNALHNEANCKIQFVIENLKTLEQTLSKLNIPLTVINSVNFDDNTQIILDLIKERSLKKVFFNNQFGYDEQKRDKELIRSLNKYDIEFISYDEKVIYPPGSIRTGEGKPYSVFTPFKKKWVENFNLDLLDIEFKYLPKKKSEIESNVSYFDFNYKKDHSVDMSIWPPGESHANDRLNLYLSKNILRYSIDRNDPIVDGTSRISPYLANGIISPKRCILEALKINNFELDTGEKGITKWIDEIIWREFYKNIMFCFPKVSQNKPFQDYTINIKWRYEESEFDAWKNGNTGFPIIDSAMRQLKSEGWMHNRLRMVVAMFLTKNMLHDWRLGESFFMQNLIDGDFASNNGGWQWSSSTGTDAAPYFRIFNPITQSINFDKEGEFIKKYVPKLNTIDKSIIHNPPLEQRNICKYPEQILDIKESRLRAIDAFKTAKS